MIIASVPDRYDAVWMNAFVSEISSELDECLRRNRRMYIGGRADTQIVLIAPDGTKHKLTVANDGTLATTPVVGMG